MGSRELATTSCSNVREGTQSLGFDQPAGRFHFVAERFTVVGRSDRLPGVMATFWFLDRSDSVFLAGHHHADLVPSRSLSDSGKAIDSLCLCDWHCMLLALGVAGEEVENAFDRCQTVTGVTVEY